ncbi:hypothetical protein Tco_0397532, partial [Tanacetum coccineum]
MPTCLGVIRGGETIVESVFKHDFGKKLVIAKCVPRHLIVAKRRHISSKVYIVATVCILFPFDVGTVSLEVYAQTSKDFTITGWPEESGIKDLFGGEICNMIPRTDISQRTIYQSRDKIGHGMVKLWMGCMDDLAVLYKLELVDLLFDPVLSKGV